MYHRNLRQRKGLWSSDVNPTSLLGPYVGEGARAITLPSATVVER